MIREVAAVRGFRRLRVLVVGDAMLDRYYVGTASRLSPEGPVPVIRSTDQRYLPGGAANTAANSRALGAATTLLSAVGDDHEAQILRRVLRSHGVNTAHLVVDPSRPTTTKLRIIADNQLIARYDHERDEDLSGDAEDMLLQAFRSLFWVSDVIIISDYMKGVVTPRFISEISSWNRDHERLVVVDSKDLSRHRFRNISVITPNHLEAQKAVNVQVKAPQDPPPRDSLEKIGRSLLTQIGTKWVIMTTGSDGALLFERNRRTEQVRAREVRSPDTVGAGDTFTAALALALASGEPITGAARIAVEAAGIAVGKAYTAVAEQHELVQRLSRLSEIPGTRNLADHLDEYTRTGKRIVFTNGAFDSLHAGHVAFLRQARKLGDVLIVGVNSDESIHKITGREPAVPEADRLSVVAALDPVDHAVLFEEETPSSLIREVRPHVHVKGGDYEEEQLPEAEAVRDVGGDIVILPLATPEPRPTAARTLLPVDAVDCPIASLDGKSGDSSRGRSRRTRTSRVEERN